MKNNIHGFKLLIAIFIAFGLILSSCNNFDELNKNPDAVSSSSVNPGNQLAYVQGRLSGYRFVEWRANAIYTMGFTQSITGFFL